jgi:transposase InsO family protein
MPWMEESTVSLRQDFVALALHPGTNRRALCRRFHISPTTGSKWIRRFLEGGAAALADRSRRPMHSPRRTPTEVEQRVLALRDTYPHWGGRKLAVLLEQQDVTLHPATITAILRRHGRLDSPEALASHAWQRFERSAPNELWQMDFKGHFPLGASGARCHPLTVLDDHSRYSLGVIACADERGATVRACLTTIFRQMGLPDQMLMDNGSPWGLDRAHRWSSLGVWLLRLGIGVAHGRPYHPQTQGKEERFHRTLLAEAIAGRVFGDLARAQEAFDVFRTTYNHVRPHEACAMQPPSQRYQMSARPYPETLPPIEYPEGTLVRKVQQGGWVTCQGTVFTLPRAFIGLPVALRPTETDGVWSVCFLRHELTRIDRRTPAAGTL